MSNNISTEDSSVSMDTIQPSDYNHKNDYQGSGILDSTSAFASCPVCWGESPPSDFVTMPCHHKMHAACIDRWLDTSKNKDCPVCRHSLKHTCSHAISGADLVPGAIIKQGLLKGFCNTSRCNLFDTFTNLHEFVSCRNEMDQYLKSIELDETDKRRMQGRTRSTAYWNEDNYVTADAIWDVDGSGTGADLYGSDFNVDDDTDDDAGYGSEDDSDAYSIDDSYVGSDVGSDIDSDYDASYLLITPEPQGQEQVRPLDEESGDDEYWLRYSEWVEDLRRKEPCPNVVTPILSELLGPNWNSKISLNEVFDGLGDSVPARNPELDRAQDELS
ncbi:uncharacterized protein BCR38DRAFT_412544 [Pseudomassariella vexata]|uniref:RING-type domain-containing protein n=1 Tax=Pseudomassariella vexata TaxID=1141098 RepID=A0A1Y2DJW7_9PEZI|nr:uncharacterized protein BCR38DRAFT_412544 [Pseudomassariella vexata]ORY59530.1 hypothetical protein BCR38DRAFT_412544 [Pseudomassariella vexata]